MSIAYAPLLQREQINDPLVDLALDLQWAWNHSSDEIWGRIDPELWSLTHNPWVVLQTASRARLEALRSDEVFHKKLETVLAHRRNIYESAAWFTDTYPASDLDCAAYFSMEFGLSEALPVYSGGLGNVAGDQLKTASDLAVPIAGVTLLYQRGYFRQVLDSSGAQRALYPYNDPMQLPIMPVRDEDGEWVRVKVPMPGGDCWLRAWQARVGRVRLYLLDSNDPANTPAARGITSELYGGGLELRLQQEIALGIGGWRLLRAVGRAPQVCHLNEGHAAFAVLERAASFMEDCGQPFDVALTVTRAGNLFTTHTPVPAGFDAFPPDLMARYLAGYAESRLKIPLEHMLALGRLHGEDAGEKFNMAYLAMRGSGAVNGVSKLHGEVSRSIFQPLFPRWAKSDVPIGHVTNGVHVPSWDSMEADTLWTQVCGRGRWRGTLDRICETFRSASDEDLWRARGAMRHQLVLDVRTRLVRQLETAGASPEDVERARGMLDPNVLTIGFARRFATYKRPNLLLYDSDRLARLLNDPHRPVQLIVAGKAHPNDAAGQRLIADWVHFMNRPDVYHRAVFLWDYDLSLAEQLVQGVDVWVNNPRRPWEACGTSGMKILVNGGLNVSELDGWWAEAYAPEVGWALGDGKEHGDDPNWDHTEARQLFDILEQQVTPLFYDRDWAGVPHGWVGRMRESMARLTPAFSSNRTVREYTERYYLPLATAYTARAANGAALGMALVHWKQQLERFWPDIHFDHWQVETRDGEHVFRLHLYLDDIPAEWVCVELFAEGEDGGPDQRYPMHPCSELIGATGGYCFTARLPATRPADHYTPRIVAHHPNASVPLEAGQIAWLR